MNINNVAGKNLDNTKLAEEIRNKRTKFEEIENLEERIKWTKDVFEKAGVEAIRFTPNDYNNLGMIKSPSNSMVTEMWRVMDGFYQGNISKEELESFFVDYCNIIASRDGDVILNVYEYFLNINYESAANSCFDEGKELAKEEKLGDGRVIYYDADIYYQAEEVHQLLKEIAEKEGKKYGLEIDIENREQNWQRTYVTGKPNFNEKWNFRAAQITCRGRMIDLNEEPPKGFSFLYKEGTNMGTEDGVVILKGNDWIERVEPPFEIPGGGKKAPNYFYLSSLFHVNQKVEENFSEYNKFLKNFIIARPNG